jgi:hypothetical protein
MANRRRKGRRTFGSTRQLPSGRWQASYLGPDGTRRVAPGTFPEAADANAWLTQTEASIAAGDWRPPELLRETFGNYGRRWLAQRLDLRPSTRELYCQRPGLGPRFWPTKSPHPLGAQTFGLGPPPLRRASRMRNDSPSVTTTMAWCKRRSRSETAVVALGRKCPQSSKGQWLAMASERRS